MNWLQKLFFRPKAKPCRVCGIKLESYVCSEYIDYYCKYNDKHYHVMYWLNNKIIAESFAIENASIFISYRENIVCINNSDDFKLSKEIINLFHPDSNNTLEFIKNKLITYVNFS